MHHEMPGHAIRRLALDPHKVTGEIRHGPYSAGHARAAQTVWRADLVFTLVPRPRPPHIGTARPAMNDLDLTRETPRLDSVPFIVADVILVGFAAFVGWQAESPLGVAPLAAISALVVTGAIAGLYPFVVNHARRQEETLRERAEQIEVLARTLGATAEQVSIAVSNLPAIAESSARQLKLAEQLPAALQSQISSLQHQLTAAGNEENAALRHELDTLRSAQTDKLAAALDGVTRAGSDLARLEALAAKHASALDTAIAHLPRLGDAFTQQTADTMRRETATAVAALQAASSEAAAALASATAEARAAFERGVRDAVSHLATQAVSRPPFPAHVATQTAVIPPAPAPIAAPAPAAPAIDDTGLDEPESSQPAAPVEPEPEAEPEPETEESTPEPEPDSESAEPAEPSAPALSNDGYTRLVATAYIGIGNKLFIRGEGPGLRQDKGVPLQFVSIGKWRWESAEMLFPAKVRLLKNDQIECSVLGEITLEPGHHHEVTAQF